MEWLERFPAHEDVIGPVQRSEAILLHGLVLVNRPRRVVELGFYRGDSTEALCAATVGTGAVVVSYDLHLDHGRAAEMMARYPHLEVRQGDQRHAESHLDAAAAPIDFLFIDASHDLATNQDTWRALEPRLAPDAVVAVHDTGLWCHDAIDNGRYGHWGTAGTVAWVGHAAEPVRGRFHQPHEVAFVRWIVDAFPAWAKMDFMSTRTFRHGTTVLQRRRVETGA